MPRHHDYDLARAVRLRVRTRPRGRPRRAGRGTAARLPRRHRDLRQAGLDRDDRGRRLAVLSGLFRQVRGADPAGRGDVPAGDRDPGRALRRREGRAQLLQQAHLPGRLPTLAGRHHAPLGEERDADRLDRGHQRPLRAHARRLARSLQRRLAQPAATWLRRALRAPLELLPRVVGGRLCRAPDPRPADRPREKRKPGAARVGQTDGRCRARTGDLLGRVST